MLQFQDAAGQSLAQGQDRAATKRLEVHLLAYFLAHLVVFLNLSRVTQADFPLWVFHFTVLYLGAVVVDFEVTLVGIHDNVVFVI